VRIRAAVPGDGAAIARIHRDNASYYVGLAPDLFRLPDEDGLTEFADPTVDDNTATTLFILAEIDDEVVGHLYAELISPQESDRFQTPSDMREVRLFIHALSVLQQYWRRGVATSLVETAEAWGREHGAAVALCDTWPGSPVSLPFWQHGMNYQTRSIRLRKPLNQ
jgi:GNAT superfamily N-acetyltransferase